MWQKRRPDVRSDISELTDRCMTRSSFLKLSVGALAATVIAGCGGGDNTSEGQAPATGATTGAAAEGEGELNLYAWTVYTTPEILDPFTAATGIKVNSTTFDSNDVMFTKLNTPGGSGFDIVTAAQLLVPQLIELNLLEKLAHDRISWEYVDESLRGQIYDPEDAFTVPKAYGATGVLYDPSAVGGTVESWNDFLELGAQPHVSGKVIMPSSAYYIVGIGLFANGVDLNTQDPAAIEEAGALIKDFAPHVLEFGGYDLDPFLNGAAILGVVNNGNARLAIQQKPELEYVYPKPQCEIWFDTFAIPEGASNVDEAYSFINFSLSPEQQVRETSASGIPGPLPGLKEQLPADTPLKDLIFIPPDVMEYLTPFIATPETQQLFTEQLTQIQAAAG